MSITNKPTFVRHFESSGYGDGAPKPMDEDDALEQAEAEIRRLKTQVEWLNRLIDRARETMVQHNPTCLLWLETVDAVRTGKI